MTSSDARWLVDTFDPQRKGTINKSTIGMFIKAINIMLNQSRRVPSCGCEFKVTAQIANSAYEQYRDEIERLYNQKSRGRKKKNV